MADPQSALVHEMLSHLKVNYVDYDSRSQVANFYANRSVFITGATGFIGKAIVEKLVRSCPDVKRIYLLIREKRGKESKDRLADLLSSQIFNRIKSKPNGCKLLEEKLRVIQGDITAHKFGISGEDMKVLSEEVSIVFASAATVRFDEPIDVAVRNNIYSVSQLVEFCDRLEHLQALIHLSTAYANCHKRDTIHEVFYEPPMRGEEIIRSVALMKQCYEFGDGGQIQDGNKHKTFDSETLREKSRTLLADFTKVTLRHNQRPNTYTYTKAISEYYLLDLVKERPERYLGEKGIPVAIVRPSIVCAAWREPEVGYVDSYNGATGAIVSLYTGVLQAMPGNGNMVADVVPVDLLANMLISTGWHMVREYEEAQKPEGKLSCESSYNNGSATSQGFEVKRDQGVYVFNFVSGYRNPLRWKQVTEMIARVAYKYPTKHMQRLPGSYFVRAGHLYDLYDWLNHRLVATLVDYVRAKLMNEELTDKTSAMAAYGRVHQLTTTLTPFVTTQWRLSDDNVAGLYSRLCELDKELFEFSVGRIDWPDYLRNYIIGSRLYLLKDEAQNVPGALKALKK